MTLNKVLVDTNVCLDMVLNRKPFAASATELTERSESDEFTRMIAAHSFDSLFYILKKNQEKKDLQRH